MDLHTFKDLSNSAENGAVHAQNRARSGNHSRNTDWRSFARITEFSHRIRKERKPSLDVDRLSWRHVSAPPFIARRDQRCHAAITSPTSYLLVADAFVCVVQLVGDDVSVASEGFIPAQRHGGWRV